MHIRAIAAVSILYFSLPVLALAEKTHEHGGQIFHAIRLETDVGISGDGPLANWDLDGWLGSDYTKLWLKSEGGSSDGHTPEKAEYWAMYSRNIATFWDAQAGLRYDDKPASITYLTVGFNGIAPYFFETEAHIFISDDGGITARLRQENDFLITQKLITQPYAEVHFSAQDVSEQQIGVGITSGELGIQTRYEVTRKFAPYIDLRYERKFGETSAIAKKDGKNSDDAVVSVGLRLMF